MNLEARGSGQKLEFVVRRKKPGDGGPCARDGVWDVFRTQRTARGNEFTSWYSVETHDEVFGSRG